MEQLLQNKGFSLNTYPEGKFWELVVEDDEVDQIVREQIVAAKSSINVVNDIL